MTPRADAQRVGSTLTLAPGSDGAGVIRRTVLPGGVRVITESVPALRSVALGYWVGVGSRDEAPSLAGASHYLEHLLFKGTRRRSALDISSAIDAVGGEINAFTGKEYTCFYARVLDEDLPLAVDVLTDVVTSSVIRSEDVDAERGVVLEEIAMHDDDPTDVVHEQFAQLVLGDSPLGRPILGTVDSITSMTRAAVSGYYRRRYQPDNLVIAAAGALDHATVVRHVRKALRGTGFETGDRRPRPPRSGRDSVLRRASDVRLVKRKTEQAHLLVGGPALDRNDERRFALGVLNAALGGGMSSRLFQEVREKRGLAYSVYSYTQQFADAGLFGVYVGCQPARAGAVVDLVREQLADVAAHGISAEELERGKGQLRGGMVLGLEDTGSRMSRIGKSELSHGDLLSVDDVLTRVAQVTADDIAEVAAAVLPQATAVAAVGPLQEKVLA
ncbi:MAG: M16 family metallopeptidase [Actinomycetales bacterium]